MTPGADFVEVNACSSVSDKYKFVEIVTNSQGTFEYSANVDVKDRIGTTSGDPHFQTFGGEKFDFQ